MVKEELLLLLVQVLLHSEKPSLNAYWWFGFRAINQFKWLMVSVEGKLFTYKIQMEAFTAPYHCKGFFFCLRVAAFSGGKGATCISNVAYGTILLYLRQYGPKTDRTCINSQGCFFARIIESHAAILGNCSLNFVKSLLVDDSPLPFCLYSY